MIAATDLPVSERQLHRILKRASVGLYPQPPRAGSAVAYLMLLPVEIARFTRPVVGSSLLL